jgi:hypothetical protein
MAPQSGGGKAGCVPQLPSTTERRILGASTIWGGIG